MTWLAGALGKGYEKPRWKFPILRSREEERDEVGLACCLQPPSRGLQEYVALAEMSCNFPDDGSLLNMCSIKVKPMLDGPWPHPRTGRSGGS